MARAPRSRSRYIQAEQREAFARRAQARGESSARALRRYRSTGGRIGDRQWREVWRDAREHPDPPWERDRKVKKPGGVIYYVGLLVRDHGSGKAEEWTFAVKRPRRGPIESRRAIAEAFGMFDRATTQRGYGVSVIGARIIGSERLVAE